MAFSFVGILLVAVIVMVSESFWLLYCLQHHPCGCFSFCDSLKTKQQRYRKDLQIAGIFWKKALKVKTMLRFCLKRQEDFCYKMFCACSKILSFWYIRILQYKYVLQMKLQRMILPKHSFFYWVTGFLRKILINLMKVGVFLSCYKLYERGQLAIIASTSIYTRLLYLHHKMVNWCSHSVTDDVEWRVECYILSISVGGSAGLLMRQSAVHSDSDIKNVYVLDSFMVEMFFCWHNVCFSMGCKLVCHWFCFTFT